MKLTEEIVQNKLASLIGKKVGWSGAEVTTAMWQLFREYAEANHLNPSDFRAENSRHSKWTVELTYKGYDIGAIDIKRTKANKHYSYFGDYCDYVYKQFCLWLWIYPEKNEDVETRILEIERLVIAREQAKQDKISHGKEVVKLLKETYNLDGYGVRQLIDFLNSNKYTLTD